MKKDWIKQLKEDKEFEEKFIKGLEVLGFPLEFKIRKKLTKKGYNNVREGFFEKRDESKKIIKTYDIHAYKDKNEKIHEDLTIVLSLLLIGDCKSSKDKDKLIFAIPDTTNPSNKSFTGPLLTSFQKAIYSRHRNIDLVVNFKRKHGNILFASDVKDTAKYLIINEKERTQKNKIKEHEKIFNIIENTIIPATSYIFSKWMRSSYYDYNGQISNTSKKLDDLNFIKEQKNNYYTGKIIIPFIITTKPILSPIITEKGEIEGINEEKFVLYEHSTPETEEYMEILNEVNNLGVFICNEKYFEEFITYIENIFHNFFSEIIENLKKQPKRLIEDLEDFEKKNIELKKKTGRSIF